MSEANQDTSHWTVSVDGDAEHGWIVGVHDGDNYDTYSPNAAGAIEARDKAVQMHIAARFQVA